MMWDLHWILGAKSEHERVFMTYLLAIFTLAREWINKITPKLSLYCTILYLHLNLFFIYAKSLHSACSAILGRWCSEDTSHRWMHDRKVMLLILPFWPQTLQQHHNTAKFHQTKCVLCCCCCLFILCSLTLKYDKDQFPSTSGRAA